MRLILGLEKSKEPWSFHGSFLYEEKLHQAGALGELILHAQAALVVSLERVVDFVFHVG